MLYHKQAYIHQPDIGIHGDCYRTVISCLLDLPRDDVPHFLHDNPDWMEFKNRVEAFLQTYGLCLFSISIKSEDFDDFLINQSKVINDKTVFVVFGLSPRHINHAVIYKGGEMIHDPHPDGGGLIGPCNDGFYWIQVLTKIQTV